MFFPGILYFLHIVISDRSYFPHPHGDDHPEEEDYDDHLHEVHHPEYDNVETFYDIESTRDSKVVLSKNSDGKKNNFHLDQDSDSAGKAPKPKTERPLWNFGPRMTDKSLPEESMLLEKVITVEERLTTENSAMILNNTMTENFPPLVSPTSPKLASGQHL